MHREQQRSRFVFRRLLATLCVVLLAVASARGQIRPSPTALANASPELIDQLRRDPYAYFRFVNRAWTERVCEVFADVANPTIVRLHGDAHVEQYALTRDASGLDDFDDSARGPAFIDIARFLASIDLATRQRGWTTHDRDAVWGRFFEGYRRGLTSPDYRPPEPDLVQQLRKLAPLSRSAYLAWGEGSMQPMEADKFASVGTAMAALDRLVRRDRPSMASGYFNVVHAGWLRMGIGSNEVRKVLIRVQGPTSDPEDDVLLEVKEVTNLEGVRCLEAPGGPPAARVIDGTRQLGRLKHDILAVGPTLLIPEAGDRAEHFLDWWVSSWEPSYREIHLSDLRDVTDLADLAFDAGVQLGAGKAAFVRSQELSASETLEGRLRKETTALVEELLAGWREMSGRDASPDR
jgi:hypothetical protein